MAQDEREQRGKQWHIDKSFSIGHLLTTILIASSVFLWAGKMDSRMAIIEERQVTTKENQARIEASVHDNLSEIKNTLLRIEARMEHKADKQPHRVQE